MADRMRFELMNACALPDFESGAFSRSATCPRFAIISVSVQDARGNFILMRLSRAGARITGRFRGGRQGKSEKRVVPEKSEPEMKKSK